MLLRSSIRNRIDLNHLLVKSIIFITYLIAADVFYSVAQFVALLLITVDKIISLNMNAK